MSITKERMAFCTEEELMLKDFFLKDVTAYPSGSRSLGDTTRSGFYARALKKAGCFLTAVAMAASVSSCGSFPSQEEIQAMKDKVPEPVKKELAAKCDSAILANIQTCLDEGGHATNSGMSVYGMVLNPEKGEKVANSVANGIKHARWEVLDTIPVPSKRTGEHYVLIEYMNKCYKEGIETRTEMKMCMGTDGTSLKMKLRPVQVDYGKPEYIDTLVGRVKAHQTQKTVSLQAAKAVQSGR